MGELTKLKGIGPKTEQNFLNLGINDIKDLLFYYPRDYEEFSEPKKIIELNAGEVATVYATIVNAPATFRKGRLSITTVWIDDGSARIRAYWFNAKFISNMLKVGSSLYFRGRVSRVKNGIAFSQCKTYTKSNYEMVKSKLSPVYALTKGITNNTIKKAVKEVLSDKKLYSEYVKEYLPKELIEKRELCDLDFAFNHVHFPVDFADMQVARKRLVYDELFIFSLSVFLNKEKTIENGRDDFKQIDENDLNDIEKALPYELTKGQKDVIADILSDLKVGKKINRLIEGDVGSGKTIIVVLISILISLKKVQTAFMAPTEVLAEQHFETINKLFDSLKKKGLSVKLPTVAILTGSTKASDRKKILEDLKNGNIDILIGTHALYSKDVVYNDLGLCIIDEQHRFGVSQRKALEDKSNNANIIVMSATPIPRTLAILLYADLDISELKDKPLNRLPIKNYVASVAEREKAYKAIKKEIDSGHQAYVICAAIDSVEDDDVGNFANYQNVVEYAKILEEYYGNGVSIGILHGKMKNDEKYEIMQKFKKGEIDILVSTTVVEVGVDVPNATFMMVEDAGYFGLAELHQLRGRVGRGMAQSYALFVNTDNNEKSKKRLEILCKSNDGFYIANEDLKLRGPGDIFGVKQSGEMNFQLADIYTDYNIFKEAGNDAKVYAKKELGEEIRARLNKYIKDKYTL